MNEISVKKNGWNTWTQYRNTESRKCFINQGLTIRGLAKESPCNLIRTGVSLRDMWSSDDDADEDCVDREVRTFRFYVDTVVSDIPLFPCTKLHVVTTQTAVISNYGDKAIFQLSLLYVFLGHWTDSVKASYSCLDNLHVKFPKWQGTVRHQFPFHTSMRRKINDIKFLSVLSCCGFDWLWDADACPEGGIETASSWARGLRRILRLRGKQIIGETEGCYTVRGCIIVCFNERYFLEIKEKIYDLCLLLKWLEEMCKIVNFGNLQKKRQFARHRRHWKDYSKNLY